MDTSFFIDFCLALLITMTCISTISSVLTLVILYRMRTLLRGNAYLRIVLHVCMCQMIYDFGFWLECENSSALEDLGSYIQRLFGTATSLWTFLISSMLLYTVLELKSAQFVSAHLNLIAGIIMVTCIALTTPTLFPANYTSKSTPSWYYWLRLTVIMYCIVGQWIINGRLRWLNKQADKICLSRPPAFDYARVSAVLRALVEKMWFYPIVQVVTRGGAVWIEAAK
jgi:hypothetical protein